MDVRVDQGDLRGASVDDRPHRLSLASASAATRTRTS
jgi:hypothetical protein